MPTCRTSSTTTISCPQYQCTHLGSINIDPTAGEITAHFSYGQSRRFGVWNRYHQQTIILKAGNPNSSWASQFTDNSFKYVLNDSTNSLTFFAGRPTSVETVYQQNVWLQDYAFPLAAIAEVGVGWDNTSTGAPWTTQPPGSAGLYDIETYTGTSNIINSYAQTANLIYPVVPPTVVNGAVQNAGPGPHTVGAYFATHGSPSPPSGIVGANPANDNYSVAFIGGQENEMLLAAIWSG